MSTTADPLYGLSQRQPPSNLQAEQALLGAILANNSALHRVAPFLKPEHFADPVNGRIYHACWKLVLAGEKADAVTLKARFEHSGVLDEVGGTRYLASLLTAMVGIINAGDYGRVVHDTWLRRQLIAVGAEVVDRAFGVNTEDTGADVVRAAADRLIDLVSDSHARNDGVVSIGAAISERIKQIDERSRSGKIDGITTGFRDLDEKMGPIQEGALVYLMAVRATGKTALALQIAVHVARRLMAEWLGGAWEKHPVASCVGNPNTMEKPELSFCYCPAVMFDSYEMSRDELSDRAISYLTGIHSRVLRRERLSLENAATLRQLEIETQHLPLLIDDQAGQSAASMAIRGRMAGRHRKIVLRITDHIQKVASEDERKDAYARTSNRWKNDAHQWGRHLVLCHPRAEAKRRMDDPRPQLGDALYGIDADADIFLALHREEMFIAPQPPEVFGTNPEGRNKIIDAYWQRREAAQARAEVYCLKNRSDAANWVAKLRWDAPTTTFSDDVAQEEPVMPGRWE